MNTTVLPRSPTPGTWRLTAAALAGCLWVAELSADVAYAVGCEQDATTKDAPCPANRTTAHASSDDAPLLLLTEVGITPTPGEFIEIHNPNSQVVALSDVYLSDATFASGGVYYYNLVTGDVGDTGGGGFGDFTARFPAGAAIPPGAYQTVSLAGSEDFASIYGADPDYELFEDGDVADAIPDMREALPTSISGQGGLSNSGEVVVLFAWDGIGDRVTDLDYLVWGDRAEAVDKTGVAIDGPDGDSLSTPYLNDTPIADQEVVAAGQHAGGESFQRVSLSETGETTSGGNGARGHDETSENLSVSWCEATTTPGQASDCPSGAIFEDRFEPSAAAAR